MHAVDLIAKHVPADELLPLPSAPRYELCCVVGEHRDCIERRHVIKKSFTAGATLKAPASQWASVQAYHALAYRPERQSSWMVSRDGGFRKLTRVEVRQAALYDPLPDSPWAGYATTSYKKHGSLITPVNTGDRRAWVFEERLADLTDPVRVTDWWDRLNAALRAGIGRSVLETLMCPPFVIKICRPDTWLEFRDWARDKYQSSVYQFLCYLLPSQEELRSENHSPDMS